jgi:hypothetical protein
VTDTELRNILKAIDSALEVYQKYEGKLTAPEISVKSMLTAVRAQISAEWARERAAEKD